MVDPEAIGTVPPLLVECGVRFVVAEALPNAKIDGMCTWHDDQSPVTGMSTLYDRFDNFWFVLRHEIEHAREGHEKRSIGMVDFLSGDNSSDEKNDSNEERVANMVAADFYVPNQEMDSFYARKHPYFSERDNRICVADGCLHRDCGRTAPEADGEI